jgi:hypothetical protein
VFGLDGLKVIKAKKKRMACNGVVFGAVVAIKVWKKIGKILSWQMNAQQLTGAVHWPVAHCDDPGHFVPIAVRFLENHVPQLIQSLYCTLASTHLQVVDEPSPLVGQLLEAVLKVEVELGGEGDEVGGADVEAGNGIMLLFLKS